MHINHKYKEQSKAKFDNNDFVLFVLCLFCVCFVFVLCLFWVCFVFVLCLFCVRFVFVLCLFCVCFVFVLGLFCVCFVFVLCLFCVCFVFVLCLFCVCFGFLPVSVVLYICQIRHCFAKNQQRFKFQIFSQTFFRENARKRLPLTR